MAEKYDPYVEAGYANRTEYINGLAEENGVDPAFVWAIADVYGPNEDFDGLVAEVEDLASMGGML